MNDDSDMLKTQVTAKSLRNDPNPVGRPKLQDGGKITGGYKVCTGGCRRLTANRGGLCNLCLKKGW